MMLDLALDERAHLCQSGLVVFIENTIMLNSNSLSNSRRKGFEERANLGLSQTFQ